MTAAAKTYLRYSSTKSLRNIPLKMIASSLLGRKTPATKAVESRPSSAPVRPKQRSRRKRRVVPETPPSKPPPDPADLFGWILSELLHSQKHGWKGLEANLALATQTYNLALAQGAVTSAADGGRLSPKRDHRRPNTAPASPQSSSGRFPYRNCHSAARYFRANAEKGAPSAQFSLAECYALGDELGRDIAEARVWFERAAAQGHVASQVRLGSMLVKGQGGPRDFFRGYGLWRDAAATGDESARVNLEKLDAALAQVEFV